MANKNVTTAKSWKKKSSKGGPIPLEVPSGNIALVRPIGVEGFFAAGLIPNSLMPIMMEAADRGKKGKKTTDADVENVMEEVIKNPEQLRQVIDMADAVTVYCVLEPVVTPVPEDTLDDEGNIVPADRDEELLYVDEVDMEDKMFILQFALGGSRSLETFREETANDVRPLSSGKDVVSKAKRPARTRG